MLVGSPIGSVSSSGHRSRPCHDRAPPCQSPTPLATTIAPIEVTNRCACSWRTSSSRWFRRRSHRRRNTPSPSSAPLPVSLSRGTRLSAVAAEAGVQLWAAPRLGPLLCARGPPLRGLAQLWPSCFPILFIYLFHRFMYILKNM